MTKILRLARANLRRHKTESVLLGILILLCVTLLSGAFPAEHNIRRIFPELTARSGAWPLRITMDQQEYDEHILSVLEADDRIARYDVYRYLSAVSTRIPDETGKETVFLADFYTAENEQRFEQFAPESALTESEIASIEHPVYIPLHQKKNLNLHEGDPFTIINGARKYTFTVAGFYESGYYDVTKLVVSDADYAVLKSIFLPTVGIGLEPKDSADARQISEDFFRTCEAEGFSTETAYFTFEQDMRSTFSAEINYVLKIIEIMAFIILAAVAVMIGYRTVSDIRDQIVPIGVLEALGYHSGEIALSYAAEYFMTALAGCTAGTALGFVLHRVLVGIAESMKGYPAGRDICFRTVAVIFAAVLLSVTLLAFLKARAVRKYPPVQAFRRGIQDHHFGKSHFPLRRTKRSVHLRLAVKGFADHAKQSIGLTLVMSITSFAIVLCFILYSFLGRGFNVLRAIAGHELSDVTAEVVYSTDRDAFRAELEAMPEIRKVLPTSPLGSLTLRAVREKTELTADVFRDYSETENIIPCTGRFPQHSNEVMLTRTAASVNRLKTGDTIELEYNAIRREYLITGLVTSLVNSNSVYLTEDGMKQLYPLYQPTAFEIYAAEGTEPEELRKILDRQFGKSAEQLGNPETVLQGDTESRIRQRAEQLMAAMTEQDGAAHVEYAIRCGDRMISGNSSGIRVRSFMNTTEVLTAVTKKLCDAVALTTRMFMYISAAVVMMILSILMESEVREQRRSLGIMKGMGYTAKELMLQLSGRIMPSVLIAVAVGTVLASACAKLLENFIGSIPVSAAEILLLDLIQTAFCFGCAYFGARKIKQISVYELMTE